MQKASQNKEHRKIRKTRKIKKHRKVREHRKIKKHYKVKKYHKIKKFVKIEKFVRSESIVKSENIVISYIIVISELMLKLKIFVISESLVKSENIVRSKNIVRLEKNTHKIVRYNLVLFMINFVREHSYEIAWETWFYKWFQQFSKMNQFWTLKSMTTTTKFKSQRFIRKKTCLMKKAHELIKICEANLILIIRKKNRYYIYCFMKEKQWFSTMTKIVNVKRLIIKTELIMKI